MSNCIKCHQPQTAGLVICSKCYEELTTQLAEKGKQLAAAVEDLEKHCRKCPHQIDNEVGCDCEGLCDPTKWRVAQKNSFTPKLPPEWMAQIERRFMAGEGGG